MLRLRCRNARGESVHEAGGCLPDEAFPSSIQFRSVFGCPNPIGRIPYRSCCFILQRTEPLMLITFTINMRMKFMASCRGRRVGSAGCFAPPPVHIHEQESAGSVIIECIKDDYTASMAEPYTIGERNLLILNNLNAGLRRLEVVQQFNAIALDSFERSIDPYRN